MPRLTSRAPLRINQTQPPKTQSKKTPPEGTSFSIAAFKTPPTGYIQSMVERTVRPALAALLYGEAPQAYKDLNTLLTKFRNPQEISMSDIRTTHSMLVALSGAMDEESAETADQDQISSTIRKINNWLSSKGRAELGKHEKTPVDPLLSYRRSIGEADFQNDITAVQRILTKKSGLVTQAQVQAQALIRATPSLLLEGAKTAITPALRGAQGDAAPVGTLPYLIDCALQGIESIFLNNDSENSTATLASKKFFIFGLKVALKAIEENKNPEQHRALSTVIATLTALSPNSTKEDWTDAIGGLKRMKITFFGFDLPNVYNQNEILSEQARFNAINSLSRDDQNPRNAEKSNVKALLSVQTDKLIKHITRSIVIKKTLSIVNLPEDADFYKKIIKRNGSEQTSDEFYSAFFRKINSELSRKNKNKSIFTKIYYGILKLYAKASFYITSTAAKYIISKVTNAYLKKATDYIKESKSNKFKKLTNETINNLIRSFTLSGSVYDYIATKPPIDDTFPEYFPKIHKKLLKTKYKNLNYVLTKDVINTITESEFITKIVMLFINKDDIIKPLINSMKSIQDVQGYTHQIELVILDQLEQLFEKLTKQSTPLTKPNELSTGRKEQFKTIFKQLIELLEKRQCLTPDEHAKRINTTSGKKKTFITEAVERLVSAIRGQTNDSELDEILKRAVEIMAVATESLIEEDRLEGLLYTFTLNANLYFEGAEQPKEATIKQTTGRIETLAHGILRKIIDTAVKERCDFSARKPEEEVNHQITKLNNQSEKLFNELTQIGENPDLSYLEQINQMSEKLEEYNNWSVEFSTNINQSENLSESNKIFLIGKNQLIQKNLKPVKDEIEEKKRSSVTLANKVKTITSITEIHTEIFDLNSPPDLIKNRNKFHTLLTELPREFLSEPLWAALHEIERILGSVTEASKERSFILREQEPNSLTKRFFKAKLKRNQSVEDTLYMEIKGEINKNCGRDLGTALTRQIDSIKIAKQDIKGAIKSCQETIGAAIGPIEDTIRIQQRSYEECIETIEGILFAEEEEEEEEEEIPSFNNLNENLGGWNQFIKENTQPQFLVDPASKITNLGMFQDRMVHELYQSAKARVDNIIGFLKNPDTVLSLTYGMLVVPYARGSSPESFPEDLED